MDENKWGGSKTLIGIAIIIVLALATWAFFASSGGRDQGDMILMDEGENTDQETVEEGSLSDEANGTVNDDAAQGDTGSAPSTPSGNSGGRPSVTVTPEPSGSIPREELPDATLVSFRNETQTGALGTYCWTTVCVLAAPSSYPELTPVTVTKKQPLTLRLDPQPPASSRLDFSVYTATEAGVSSQDNLVTSFSVPAGRTTEFRLDVVPGTYLVDITSRWPEGDAQFIFKVQIEQE